jgi:hypothetical protein
MAIRTFGTHLPICFGSDSSSPTVHVAIASAFCRHGASYREKSLPFDFIVKKKRKKKEKQKKSEWVKQWL